MAFLRSRSSWARPSFALGLALAIAAGGCQAILGIDETSFAPDAGSDGSPGDAGDGGSDGAIDAPPPSPELHFSPPDVYLHEGDDVEIDVTIDRAGFAGDVNIKLVSVGDAGATGLLPGARGLSAPETVIVAGSSTGSVHLHADLSSDLGPMPVTFEATFDEPVDASIHALVGGAAGTPDITFGTNGVVSDIPSSIAYGVAIAPDGSFYITGQRPDGASGSKWLLAHYFADGSADAAFNSAILAIPSLNIAGSGAARDVALTGSVLLVGGHESTSQFAVRRFSTSGSLDVTFGNSGMFVPNGASQTGDAYGVAFSATGEGLAVGTITNSTATHGVAFRFPPVGNTVESQAQYVFDQTQLPHAIAAVPDAFSITQGYIGATQTFPDGGSSFLVQALDVGFQDAGAALGGSGVHGLIANDIAITPDAGLVVAGLANNDIQPGDTFITFGTSPLAVLVDDENLHHGIWDANGYRAVAVQADGKILVVSDGGGSGTQHTDLTRYLPSGDIDTSFDASGIVPGDYMVAASAGDGFETNFMDVAVAPDGRIIVVGTNENTGIYITRIWP